MDKLLSIFYRIPGLFFTNDVKRSVGRAPDSAMVRPSHEARMAWVGLVINLLSFVVLSALAFSNNQEYLFYGLDGNYMRSLAKDQVTWKGLEFGFGNNFFQSMGNVWFPLNEALLPGFRLAALWHRGVIDPVVAYVIFSIELFVVSYLIARRVGMDWAVSLFTAWVLPLVCLPYVGLPVLFHIMVLAPQTGTLMAVTASIVLMFSAIGKRGVGQSLWLIAGIVSFLFYLAVALPASIVMSVPILAITGAACLYWTDSNAERVMKIAMAILGLLVLVLAGVPQYILGLIKYTAAYFFATELVNDRMTWWYVSILFHSKAGATLFVLGCLGAIVEAMMGDHSKRSLARGVLLTVVAIIVFGILTKVIDFWRGPSPVYFEFLLWPFYAVYAVAFIRRAIVFALKKIQTRPVGIGDDDKKMRWLLLGVATATPWFILMMHTSPLPGRELFPEPPPKTSIVEVLEREISLLPNAAFRGRVATLTGRNIEGSADWSAIGYQDYLMRNRFGTEHRGIGLWHYGIPTLYEYSPFITPACYLFTKSFFAIPGDRQMRNIMMLRQPDLKSLAMIGVRFVITDKPMEEGRLRTTFPMADMGNLYLVEVDAPNIGQYSPQHVIASGQASETIRILSRKDFDPKKMVVTEEPIAQNLVPATSGQLTLKPGSIQVTGTSQGVSMLLLPLEFSRCLSVISEKETANPPKIFRANLVQTGILFERTLDASIRFFTGPFNNSSCRLSDVADFKRLGPNYNQ